MKKSELNKNAGAAGDRATGTPTAITPRATSAKRGNAATAAETGQAPESQRLPRGNDQSELASAQAGAESASTSKEGF